MRDMAEKIASAVKKLLMPSIQDVVQKEVGRLMRLEDKIDSIDRRLAVIEHNPFLVASNILSVRYASSLLEDFEKQLIPNPLTARQLTRRRELTVKLEKKQITSDEAKELRDILNKELEEARATGNFLAMLLILFLLGLVIAYLSR